MNAIGFYWNEKVLAFFQLSNVYRQSKNEVEAFCQCLKIINFKTFYNNNFTNAFKTKQNNTCLLLIS